MPHVEVAKPKHLVALAEHPQDDIHLRFAEELRHQATAGLLAKPAPTLSAELPHKIPSEIINKTTERSIEETPIIDLPGIERVEAVETVKPAVQAGQELSQLSSTEPEADAPFLDTAEKVGDMHVEVAEGTLWPDYFSFREDAEFVSEAEPAPGHDTAIGLMELPGAGADVFTLWEQARDESVAEQSRAEVPSIIVESLAEHFEAFDVAESEHVMALLDEIVQAASEHHELIESELDNPEKEKVLLELCEELFVTLGVNYDETTLQEFARSLIEYEPSRPMGREEAETEYIDEGTHEKKFDYQVLLRLLAQLAGQQVSSTAKLGRLALKFKMLPAAVYQAL